MKRGRGDDDIDEKKSPVKENKKAKPLQYNTCYPSQEELSWYANNGLFTEMASRLKDMTTYNVIKDAMKRREHILDLVNDNKVERNKWEKFDANVTRLIAIRMDIKDVQGMACYSVLFATFATDDKFWKEKFLYDYPEVAQIFDYKLPKCVNVIGRLPWKRCYVVTRYYMTLLRTAIVEDIEPQIVNVGIEHDFKYDQKKEIVKRKTMIYLHNIKKQVGDEVILTFEQFIVKHHGLTLTSYLNELVVNAKINRGYMNSYVAHYVAMLKNNGRDDFLKELANEYKNGKVIKL